MASYSQQIDAATKGCVLFLVDQSSRMQSRRADDQPKKAEEAAWLVNRSLAGLAALCHQTDCLDIAVLGYHGDEPGHPQIKSLLAVEVADPWISAPSLGEHIKRVARLELPPINHPGGGAEQPIEMPLWIEPAAAGTSPQCEALYKAYQLLEKWISAHPASFPPIIVHVTGGPSDDGSAAPYGKSLCALSTEDGPVLLLNCYLADDPSWSVFCPHDQSTLPDGVAWSLFRMSSLLPAAFCERLKRDGRAVQPGARTLAVNVDLFSAILPLLPIASTSSSRTLLQSVLQLDQLATAAALSPLFAGPASASSLPSFFSAISRLFPSTRISKPSGTVRTRGSTVPPEAAPAAAGVPSAKEASSPASGPAAGPEAPAAQAAKTATRGESPDTEAAQACAAKPTVLDENVQFTVYRPEQVQPERWYPLLAFAHLDQLPPEAPPDQPQPIEQVRREAEHLLGKQIEHYQERTQDSTHAVPRAGQLTFVPEMDGVEFEPARQTIEWKGEVHTAQFRMRASESLDGQTVRGRLSVFLGVLLVADIPLRLRVDSSQAPAPDDSPLESTSARPYRKIFASYSHKDEPIVRRVEEDVQSLGDRYLRDCRDLRSGERWSEGLCKLIDQADVFQLFWSTNSMHSDHVRREWEHALARRPEKGESFIRPTYWETPFPESPEENLPPQELRQLHFTRLAILDLPAVASGGPPGEPMAARPAVVPAPAPTVTGGEEEVAVEQCDELEYEEELLDERDLLGDESVIEPDDSQHHEPAEAAGPPAEEVPREAELDEPLDEEDLFAEEATQMPAEAPADQLAEPAEASGVEMPLDEDLEELLGEDDLLDDEDLLDDQPLAAPDGGTGAGLAAGAEPPAAQTEPAVEEESYDELLDEQDLFDLEDLDQDQQQPEDEEDLLGADQLLMQETVVGPVDAADEAGEPEEPLDADLQELLADEGTSEEVADQQLAGEQHDLAQTPVEAEEAISRPESEPVAEEAADEDLDLFFEDEQDEAPSPIDEADSWAAGLLDEQATEQGTEPAEAEAAEEVQQPGAADQQPPLAGSMSEELETGEAAAAGTDAEDWEALDQAQEEEEAAEAPLEEDQLQAEELEVLDELEQTPLEDAAAEAEAQEEQALEQPVEEEAAEAPLEEDQLQAEELEVLDELEQEPLDDAESSAVAAIALEDGQPLESRDMEAGEHEEPPEQPGSQVVSKSADELAEDEDVLDGDLLEEGPGAAMIAADKPERDAAADADEDLAALEQVLDDSHTQLPDGEPRGAEVVSSGSMAKETTPPAGITPEEDMSEEAPASAMDRAMQPSEAIGPEDLRPLRRRRPLRAVGVLTALAAAFLLAVGIGTVVTFSLLSARNGAPQTASTIKPPPPKPQGVPQGRRFPRQRPPQPVPAIPTAKPEAAAKPAPEEPVAEPPAEQMPAEQPPAAVATEQQSAEFEQLFARASAAAPYRLDQEALEKARQLAQTDQQRSRLEAIEQQVEQYSAARQQALAALAGAVGDVTRYQQQIEQFISQWPDAPLSKELAEVQRRDLPLLQLLVQWQSLVDRWSAWDMRTVAPADAAAMVKQAETLLAVFDRLPDAEAIRSRLPALRAVAARVDQTAAPLEQQLVEMFQQRAASIPFVLQTRDGKRYYLPDRPRWDVNPLQIQYATSPDLKTASTQIDRQAVDLTESGPVSHGKVAEAALEDLASIAPGHWESVMFRIMQIVTSAPRVDPIVRLTWLRRVMAVGCAGSEPLRSAFGQHLQLLQNADIADGLNWLDPEDPQLPALRGQAQAVLDQLPDLRSAADKAAAQFKQLQSLAVPQRAAWAAVAYRDDRGTWQIGGGPAFGQASGPLLAMERPDEQAPVELVPIGRLQAGSSAVDPAQAAHLRQGQPVVLLLGEAGE